MQHECSMDVETGRSTALCSCTFELIILHSLVTIRKEHYVVSILDQYWRRRNSYTW